MSSLLINEHCIVLYCMPLLLLQVVKERDMIGAQLIRRNDEMTLLYEKLKIVQMTMHKAELQYNERLDDIRVLRLEIRRLRLRVGVLEKNNQAMDDLRSAASLLPTRGQGQGPVRLWMARLLIAIGQLHFRRVL